MYTFFLADSVVIKFTLEQAMKTQRGGRSTALLFFNLGVRSDQRHAPAALPREMEQVPIVQADGLVPGPVWMDAENIAPIAIRSPYRPARSASLYQLLHPGP